MATTYPARAKTGLRSRDVQNPLFKEAEARVLAWLEAQDFQVVDARAAKTYFDFRIGAPGAENLAVFTLDVKCDQYAASTGRVAWETHAATRGFTRLSWGLNPNLDYVAFVLPSNNPQWTLLLVDAGKVRAALDTLVAGRDYHPFDKQGEDARQAAGLAIQLAALRRVGAIVREAQV